ncbi:hypothetical protein [uncultured Tateyamaria sp.]|uniref:hypothetical protein n=1 Tax=uncultured Tateyamaria sp. TaxID=455651 RepID=UPI00261027E1|nr:hypothetical protein [uncultured Tateyamaria sp.]
MTKPIFDTRVSLGNLIHIGILVGTVVVGATVALGTIERLEVQIGDMEEDVSGFDDRLRAVETTTAMQGQDFKAMSGALGKLEAQLVENNRLLRQLLSRK